MSDFVEYAANCFECKEPFLIKNILSKQEYEATGMCFKCRKMEADKEEKIKIIFDDTESGGVSIEIDAVAEKRENPSKALMVATAIFILITEAEPAIVELVDKKIRELMGVKDEIILSYNGVDITDPMPS